MAPKTFHPLGKLSDDSFALFWRIRWHAVVKHPVRDGLLHNATDASNVCFDARGLLAFDMKPCQLALSLIFSIFLSSAI
jgi:hypothetical protein